VAPLKILVIDDSKVIHERVREMLPKGNIEVLEAKDGLQGLNLIRQERPNLIMLDFLLPRLSGWEVYQQIQASQELQHIPLVLMSGRKEEVTAKLSEPFEFFEFIQKPFDQKDLSNAIKAAMAKAKRRPVKPVVTETTTTSAAEIQVLHQRIHQMQAEIDTLKKQLSQLVAFIKQKLK